MNRMINESYCTDISTGSLCVYGWCDTNNKLFYIGSGSERRSMDTSKDVRTPSFNERISRDAHLLWFAKNASKEDAEHIEHMLIQYARMLNFDIVNVIGMFSENKRHYFLYRLCGGEEIEHNIFEKDFMRFVSELNSYNFVLDSFFMFFRDMSYGIVRTDKLIFPETKDDKRTYWTINGVTKTAAEWCKQYGQSHSNVLRRTKTYGLTIEQALSFPPAKPYAKYGSAIEQWKKLGLL